MHLCSAGHKEYNHKQNKYVLFLHGGCSLLEHTMNERTNHNGEILRALIG